MKNIYLLNFDKIWNKLKDIENQYKISDFLEMSGVQFYDEKKEFVKESSVKVVGIGGIEIDFFKDNYGDINIDNISKIISKMPINSFKMSYLNSSSFTDEEINKKIFEFKHFSVLHTVTLNILVSGISTSVENEFCCQRDILHLSRITEARTNIQSNPSFVILNEDIYRKTSNLITQYKKEIQKIESPDISKKDFLECKNMLFPSSKATAFILSGTVSNFIKLCKFIEDDGKELEMKKVLRKIDEILEDLLPKLKA